MKTLRNIFTVIAIFSINLTFANPNNILKNGLYFQVKVENVEEAAILPLHDQFNYFDIEAEENSEKVTCYAGIFKSKEEATVAENTLRFKGFANAVTVAFFNEQELTAEEAVAMLSNQNQLDLTSDKVSLNEMDVMLQAIENPDAFYYSIQVWITDFSQAEQLIEFTHSNELFVKQLQKGNYTVGQYKSMGAAKEAMGKMEQKGIAHKHITAYYSGLQLSALAAKELESYFAAPIAVK